MVVRRFNPFLFPLGKGKGASSAAVFLLTAEIMRAAVLSVSHSNTAMPHLSPLPRGTTGGEVFARTIKQPLLCFPLKKGEKDVGEK